MLDIWILIVSVNINHLLYIHNNNKIQPQHPMKKCPVSPSLSPAPQPPSPSTHSLHVSQINPTQHPFTFQSQQQSNQYSYLQLDPHDKYKQMHDDSNQIQTQQSQYRQQLEKQYKLRVQSLIKGYNIKIVKEQETYELKQMKYVQEIQYLKRQLKQFMNMNNTNKQKNNYINCSICSNGQILNFMKNMMDALETDHHGCLSEKSILNTKIIALEQKVGVLELENQQTEDRYQKIKVEVKQLKLEKEVWEREKREKDRQFREIEREYQSKEIAFEQEVVKQKIMQKELENEIKKIQQRHIEDVIRMRQPVPVQGMGMSMMGREIKQLRNSRYNNQPRQHRQYEQSMRGREVKPIPVQLQQYDQYQTIAQPSINIDYQPQVHLPKRVRQRQRQRQTDRNRLFGQQIQPLRPSLKANTNHTHTHTHIDSKMNTNMNMNMNMSMSNIHTNMYNSHTNTISHSHMAPHWKTKMQQTYADYANSKRKINKNNNNENYRHAFFESTPADSFETFRPMNRSTTPAPRNSNLMKYSYLQ